MTLVVIVWKYALMVSAKSAEGGVFHGEVDRLRDLLSEEEGVSGRGCRNCASTRDTDDSLDSRSDLALASSLTLCCKEATLCSRPWARAATSD